MTECIYRHDLGLSDRVGCNNYGKLLHNGTVPVSFCSTCMFRASSKDTELDSKPTQNLKSPCSGCPDQYTSTVPAREGQKEIKTTGTIRREGYVSRSSTLNPIEPPTDRDWAVVVTTAPRTEPTIDECVQSIKQAGWNPVVFAEPDSIHLQGVRYVANEIRLGAWFNWLKSVKWALKNTIAQYIMTVQDDSLFHPDSRSFVESIMWPSNTTGFISLYTASHYSADLSGNLKPYGVNKLKTTSLWGACALVFPRPVLQDIIDHPVAQGWLGVAPKDMTPEARVNFNKRREESPQAINNVDSAIGRVLNALHLDMYVVDPSPVYHIAVRSSLNHGSNTGKRNCSRCADHSLPLDSQVFPNRDKILLKSGVSNKIKTVLEIEIGYTIVCETCIEFLNSINSARFSDVQDLVIQLYTHVPFPNEWRKKHKGRTSRLQRIEDLIKPLLTSP